MVNIILVDAADPLSPEHINPITMMSWPTTTEVPGSTISCLDEQRSPGLHSGYQDGGSLHHSVSLANANKVLVETAKVGPANACWMQAADSAAVASG
jgi:hypothetical protein